MIGDKGLTKAFDDFSRPYGAIQGFSDVLEMLVCEFCPHDVNQETNQLIGRYKETYLEVVRRFKNDDHIRKYYPPLCKALLDAYNKVVTPEGGWGDPLGDYFQEIASDRDKSWRGQFFTPVPLCDMMANMVSNGNHTPNQEISDPACGSGRTLIAYDRTCPPGSMNFYVGVDTDPRCIRIAAINFFFHGMRGILVCGNSLSLEARFGYRVWLPEIGWGIEHLDAAACQQYIGIPYEPCTLKLDKLEIDLSDVKGSGDPGEQLQLF
ncbi:MAG: N-6 DNA methylase [Bacteroidota bacterium]